jgi:hypothetical protein
MLDKEDMNALGQGKELLAFASLSHKLKKNVFFSPLNVVVQRLM